MQERAPGASLCAYGDIEVLYKRHACLNSYLRVEGGAASARTREREREREIERERERERESRFGCLHVSGGEQCFGMSDRCEVQASWVARLAGHLPLFDVGMERREWQPCL